MLFLSLEGVVIGVVIAVAAVVVLVIIYAIWYFTTKNGLISVRNDTEEAFSAMDVHMKRRYDLIPNLVATCKGYAKFEGDTLVKVTEARQLCLNAETTEDKCAAESKLALSLRTLLNSVHEAYPELKANTQFNNLSKQLEQLEHEIAQSRKYYNAKVKLYNTKIEQFPSSIVAGRMRLERKSYFEIEDVQERQAPTVSFD